MKRYRVGILTLGLLSLTSLAMGQMGQQGAPGNVRPTGVTYKYVYGDTPGAGKSFFQQQETDRWCWAATAAMIMAFHGQRQWTQCIQADDSFPGKINPTTCCDDKESPLCNRTGWPHFERYGFTFKVTAELLEWHEVVDQIDRHLPLAVAVKFFTGGGHMGSVIGYQIDEDDEQWVLVIDPDGFHGAALLKFKHLFGVAADGAFRHWMTYYDIQR